MKNKWISVNDSLPEDSQRVLVYVYSKEMVDDEEVAWEGFDLAFYLKEELQFVPCDQPLKCGYWVSEVLGWMPLPNPPNAKEAGADE